MANFSKDLCTGISKVKKPSTESNDLAMVFLDMLNVEEKTWSAMKVKLEERIHKRRLRI